MPDRSTRSTTRTTLGADLGGSSSAFRLMASPMAGALDAAALLGALGQKSAPATEAAPPPPVSRVYDTAQVDTSSTLEQVDKVNEHYLRASRALDILRKEFQQDSENPGNLHGALGAYLKKYPLKSAAKDPKAVNWWDEFSPTDGAKPWPAFDKRIEALAPGASYKAGNQTVTQNEQSALFDLSRAAQGDIRIVERLRFGLTGARRARQAALAQAEEELEQLDADIAAARKDLDRLARSRAEALDDQAAAQRLLAEHWAAVEGKWAERKRTLEGRMGLYYVRVRETPAGLPLPDPLELRYSDADDLVPGCASETMELPEELHPFLEAVYDIPLGDWAALRDRSAQLPGRERLQSLVRQRRERLARPAAQPGGSALAARLGPLRQQNQALTAGLAKRPFNAAAALSETQLQARRLLTLEDLMTGPPHALRAPAQALHQRLGNAAACLAQGVRTLSPGLRAQWAELAQVDRLPLRNPSRWPGLEQAENQDFNGVRTLVELVGWWFRQLHDEADGASVTALGNYLRAALMAAGGDDPDQILSGQLASLPGRFRVGELVRLKLNREAAPGALLHLLGPDQQVAGALRVEDSDEQGVIAVITQVLDPEAELSTACRVGAARSRRS